MCGIAGELSLRTCVRTDCNRAGPMLDAILHRGPDGTGAWQDPEGRASLLHCRLAIVDVEHGQQPMHDTLGHVTITFNGEIYGFEKLRQELQATGYQFQTRSDTEVLIALYLRDGPDFVAQLEGEFAFVIYDRRKKQALLTRDRFGVKPLFYSENDGLLLFGSEIKAILSHPNAERAINPEVLHRRMHGVLLPEETVFRGIQAVAPGTTMFVGADRGIIVRRHADLDPEAAGTLSLEPDAALNAFEEAFTAAVSERLQGDVPVGLYLSAGVDSNLIAAVLCEISDDPHSAFTIGFETPGYAEADDAAVSAERFELEHIVEHIGNGDLDTHFARSVWHAEMTVPNGHGTAKMSLSRRASEKVKVILTGEGADEIHGGYAYFRHSELLMSASDRAGRRAVKHFLVENGALDGVLSKATPKLQNQLAGSNSSGVPYAAMRASILEELLGYVLSRDLQAAARPDPAGQLLDWLDQRAPGARRLDDVTLSRFTSAITDMSTYNLSYLGDRAEMANSVEGRLPYLDKRVVDLLWGLPYNFHLNETSNKTLIRRALAKRLPNPAQRYKRMFLAPPGTSTSVFEGPIAKHWLSTEVIKASGFFQPRAVKALRMAHSALPRNTGFRRVLEGFLMTAISAHLLDHLFCKDFQGSLSQFRLSTDQLRAHGVNHTRAQSGPSSMVTNGVI